MCFSGSSAAQVVVGDAGHGWRGEEITYLVTLCHGRWGTQGPVVFLPSPSQSTFLFLPFRALWFQPCPQPSSGTALEALSTVCLGPCLFCVGPSDVRVTAGCVRRGLRQVDDCSRHGSSPQHPGCLWATDH